MNVETLKPYRETPEADTVNAGRRIIFISHANPADNDFTIWLCSRLSAMGYKVWADLQDLKGGSKHWQEIEQKIRDEAEKVLVVTSKASRKAEGVDQEINIAKGIEKELGLQDFIIQLKIDDLPYTQLPPALNNRIAISFEENWGDGLRELVKQLEEEGIARFTVDSSSAQFFLTVLEKKADHLVEVSESAFASWLPIDFPKKLYVYTFSGRAKVITDQLSGNNIPAYSHADTLISFALPDALAYGAGIPVENIVYVETESQLWIEDKSTTDFFIPRSDRRKTFNGLLNQAWDIELRNRGFAKYQLANEEAYFLQTTGKQIVKEPYQDPLGRRTRPITLVGESPKYSALWHAAISVRAALRPQAMYSVRLHVAFTDDGITPIADGERAFKLRRSFCKSFWNDRWRRIYFALINRLLNGQENILISTGGNQSIKVGRPISLDLSYSISSDLAEKISENEEDELEEIVEENTYVEFDEDFGGNDE